jgi:hypothetical protein
MKTTTEKARRDTWLTPSRICLALLLLGFVLLGIWGVSVLRTVRSLQDHLRAAEALMEGDPLQALQEEPETVTHLLHAARADVVQLRRQTGVLAQLGPALGWLPRVGPLLADAAPLVELADGLTEAGVLLWDAASPALVGATGDLDLLPRLAAASELLQPSLPSASAAVARAQAARAKIDVGALPWRVRGPLEKIDPLLPWLDEGLALAEAAPPLLGVDVPRTYLILALNEDELRPGGGFITGVGEVRLDNGRIVKMNFRDAYAVDDFSQPYPDPPEPLNRFLGVDLWVFRDSNWSPDFPTAARQAVALYRPGYAVEIDGVVAVDQYAVQQLVGALGPLTVSGVDAPVTGATLFDYIHQAWAPEDGELDGEWWRQRKDFMGTLTQAALARLQSGQVDARGLADVTLRLLEEKHLLIYVEDDAVASLLAEQGWDEGVRASQGDYLMLNEANLGYNKASAKVQRALHYRVDLTQSPPHADLTVVYTHTSDADVTCTPEIRYDPVYTEMMDRCYWAYLRLYLPKGTVPREASRHPIPASALHGGSRWEGTPTISKTETHLIVGQALLLPPSSREMLTFDYTLPESVLQRSGETWRYRLDVQKQPGVVALPLDFTLRLPPRAEVVSVAPTPTVTGEVLRYTLDLRRDTTITVDYRLP